MFDSSAATLLAPTPLVSPAPAKPPLNKGQQAAADGFFAFLFTEEEAMGITGPGGVGKTFTMAYMIDEIMPRYFEACKLMGIQPQYTEVVMTATTNKAAEVLGQATNRPTSTIYSFMNLKVQDDYSTGVSKVVPTKSWKVHENKIIFVDESSMMDTVLRKYIREGTRNCKIVFVGDHCQLKNVAGHNPIYNEGITFYELTQPMRTGVPELLEINNQLRKTVETGAFQPIRLVPGVIDLLDDQQIQAEIANRFIKQDINDRILAYTNKRVIAFNDHIRGLRSLPDEFSVGEKLINNAPLHLPGRMMSVEEEIEIVGQERKTEMIHMEGEVFLEVRYMDIKTNYGETIKRVPVPVDREHYTALVKYFGRAKNWSKYFELRNFFPDFRPRDSATVYKAQGSTYDIPFIDLGDISTCNNPDQVARMLYVAFSRARHRVYLYGELAQKYGGLIQ